MMNKVDLAVLPVLNVDGYVYSWTKVGEKFSLFTYTLPLRLRAVESAMTNVSVQGQGLTSCET